MVLAVSLSLAAVPQVSAATPKMTDAAAILTFDRIVLVVTPT